MQLAPGRKFVQGDDPELIGAEIVSGVVSKTPEELADIVSVFASSVGWIDKVRLRVEQRWYERVHDGPDYDIWVISWMPGQSTGFHDHGASSGAFVVAAGILEEHRPGERTRVINPGKPLAFGPDYAHDVRNVSLAPAVSVHAYSPPLGDMNEYELDGAKLVPRDRASGKAEPVNQEWRVQTSKWTGALSIEQMLSVARARLQRLSPDEAYEAVAKTGSILVDIRSEGQRAIEGTIPGALIVERNVLEWRFDPASSARLPIATGYDLQVIVFCSEGYTSSLAAAALQDLGLSRATDVVDGFHAWRASGLPILPSGDMRG
jgi:rhodanese-related sulfurtransferase